MWWVYKFMCKDLAKELYKEVLTRFFILKLLYSLGDPHLVSYNHLHRFNLIVFVQFLSFNFIFFCITISSVSTIKQLVVVKHVLEVACSLWILSTVNILQSQVKTFLVQVKRFKHKSCFEKFTCGFRYTFHQILLLSFPFIFFKLEEAQLKYIMLFHDLLDVAKS